MMAITIDATRGFTSRCPLRKKFQVDDRVPTELWTLFVAKAVKGGSPTHNKAGSVSIPPDPAIDEINPAKNAIVTSIN
tara:strand:+ start:1631 stop:1864 length:234 start_codon:yes stop_codon:yes gene_type:complete